MGKGDARRPTQVDEETFQKRWDKAFQTTPLDVTIEYSEDGKTVRITAEEIGNEAREAGSEQGREVE